MTYSKGFLEDYRNQGAIHEITVTTAAGARLVSSGRFADEQAARDWFNRTFPQHAGLEIEVQVVEELEREY